MMPTANQVAWAIVAACRETGDDPIAVASGETKGISPRVSVRARHYALHALLEVFKELPRETAVRLVGAPGDPRKFSAQSWGNVAKPVGTMGRRYANWFEESALFRVVDAIKAAAPIDEDEVAELVEEAPAPAKPLVKQAVAEPIREPTRPFISERQANAYRMLQQAAANTAKLPPRGQDG